MIPTKEQPYPLPVGWQWCRLGDIATLFTGNSINEKIKAEKYLGRTDGLIYIATKDINFDNQIDYETNIRIPASDNFKTAPANTPLLCIEGGSAGRKLGFTNQAVHFVNKLCAFVTSEKNPKLIYYFLQTQNFAKQFIEKKHGLIGGVSIKNLSEINFPLPPLDEQQRIVDLLDELFEKLDEAKALAQGVVDSSELRRAAILHKAFSGELTKIWRDEHGITLDSWQCCLLSELLLPMQTKRPTGKTFRYIDIDSIDNERQSVREPKIIETIKAPSRASRAIESGNVLFSMVRPYLKNIAFIDDDLKNCIASTGFFVCKCKEGLSPKFLYQFLCYDGTINYLMQFMRGDNSPSIRKDEFLSTSINLPSLDEQKEIVRLLDDLLGREQQTKDLATKTWERIELMKKSILARAFRGELDSKNF